MELTTATKTLLGTPGCGRLRHWLMLLEKPGDWMIFHPLEIGLNAKSIQVYTNALTLEGNARYAVRNGGRNNKQRGEYSPVYVMRVQPVQEK